MGEVSKDQKQHSKVGSNKQTLLGAQWCEVDISRKNNTLSTPSPPENHLLKQNAV